MLISTTAKIKWNPRIKKHYVNLGYKFTKMGDEFEVDVNHLTKGSNTIVKWKCNHCDKITVSRYDRYKRCVKDDGKTYCQTCATELFGKEKALKTNIKKGKSFEQWCIDNNRLDILVRWDEKLNKCKPNEISYGSRKKYWFKCPLNEHKSELKNINSFTSGRDGAMDCKQCNSIMQYCIDNNCINKLNLKKNYELGLDLWNIPRTSNIKIWFLCTNKDTPYHNDFNGYECTCAHFVQGSGCPYCSNAKVHSLDSLGQDIINEYGEDFLWKVWSDKNTISPFEIKPKSNIEVWWNCLDENKNHKPYLRSCYSSKQCKYRCPECVVYVGEKEVGNILSKHNIKYIIQYRFEDCRCKIPLPFDFYLPDYNILIEYDGEQHFRPVSFGGINDDKSLDKFIITKIHDTIKNIYAKNNNIKLIRIPYYDFNNIEEILVKELNLNK